MPFDQSAAEAYYNTLPPEEKAKVDASGGPSVAWLKNAANAGVPDAIVAAGGTKGPLEKGGDWEQAGGAVLDPSGAASASEWMGKRAPTPSELRKWAQEQHARYIAGDRSAQDEDYQRYTDRQLAAWINEGWDVKGGWKQGWNPAGKASDMQPRGGAGGGGGGGGKGGTAVTPVATPYYGQDDPLQRHLTNLLSTQGGTFGGADEGGALQGGGVFWQDNQAGVNATPVVPAVQAPVAPKPVPQGASSALRIDQNGGTYSDPYEAAKQGGVYAPMATFQGSAQNAMTPQVSNQSPSTAANPWGTVTGAPLGGLEGLVDPRARRKDARRNPNSWF